MSLLRFSNSGLGVRAVRRCFSSSVASRAKLQIFNPATEELVKEVEADTPQTVQAKFVAAKEAQKNWAAVPLPYKLRIVETFCNLLTTHHETLARTLTSEMGKPINQAKAEVSATVGRCQFFIKHTPSVLEEKIVNEGKGMKEKITREPLGVVGNISAWNYPYFVGTNVLIPALLTGNSVLYKPSEHSTLTGQAIISLLHQAGVPKDALACVVGKGDIGSALLEQPINGIYFTGSLATGKRIASKVGGTFMRIQLELGGKDPTYVCDDAKVDVAAASLADGAMYNTGQSCCSVERIYVHKNIYNAFVDKFVSEVKSFKIGAPTESSTYIGPLTRKEQVGILKDHVSDAVKQGAKLLVGGSPTSVNGKGYYFEPTVLVNVNHNMKVMREESFGPIIGIQKVESDEEAVKLMNDTDYGLTSGVYSTNEQRASVILSRINSGTVYWNCCDRVSPALPWSGRKGSGVGSTLGTDGILAFVQPKAWHLKSA